MIFRIRKFFFGINMCLCHLRYDARDRAVSTVERLHIRGDRWEHVADMNKVCDWSTEIM